jgi:phosphoadenosine phosphosulfate reductase
VRWDEQSARADETFFSPRHDAEKYPPHDRVHPILQFDGRALWDAMWGYVVPESVEDLDGTTEREGRAQNKEGLMERLRDLGYT